MSSYEILSEGDKARIRGILILIAGAAVLTLMTVAVLKLVHAF